MVWVLYMLSGRSSRGSGLIGPRYKVSWKNLEPEKKLLYLRPGNRFFYSQLEPEAKIY